MEKNAPDSLTEVPLDSIAHPGSTDADIPSAAQNLQNEATAAAALPMPAASYPQQQFVQPTTTDVEAGASSRRNERVAPHFTKDKKGTFYSAKVDCHF